MQPAKWNSVVSRTLCTVLQSILFATAGAKRSLSRIKAGPPSKGDDVIYRLRIINDHYTSNRNAKDGIPAVFRSTVDLIDC